MQDSLPLKTKLFIPKIHHSLVHRPRLISQINAGIQGALTLISAPPGFGKTTALAEWAAVHSTALAWVSLDAEDNDPIRFLSYLLFALGYSHIAGTENAALLQSVESIPPRITTERLLRDLENFPDPFVVVLDDYHVITAQPVHDCLAYILDHLPSQMHLVIATRADPPIPLARLRARGDLLELRVDDLRFSVNETASFLEQIIGVSFTPGEIELLEARTEGWIAGLQLAALSMQGRKDIHSFIQTFSGSHRYILDYLVEEVINRQPQTIQDFLLRTSILERLSGPLCDALFVENDFVGEDGSTHLINSQSILGSLEKSNLFLIPLDDERRWYRYHHLFAELLQAQLKQSMPGLIPTLNLRASDWLEQNGYRVEAVQYAIRAGNYERAADLIEQHGQESWRYSDLTFLMLISRLPIEMLQVRPKLGFYYAWMLITQGRLDASEALLQQLTQFIDENETDPEIRGIRGFIQLLFTYIATMSGNTQSIDLPDKSVLEIIPETFLAMRNSADVVYAMLLSFRGDFDLAGEILLNTIRRDLAANGTTATPISVALHARLLTLQGRLHEAAGLCQKYLKVVSERGKWRFYLSGDLNIVFGDVLREWNRLDEAEHEIREGIQSNEPWNAPQGVSVGYIALARLQQARGDLEAALQTLEDAEKLNTGRTLTPDLASELRSLQISYQLVLGNLTSAAALDEYLSGKAISDYRWELEFIVLARLRIAQERFPEAGLLLEQLSRQAKAGGRVLRQVKIDLLWAQALLAQKKVLEALDKLESCLALAEPHEIIRTFLDEKERVPELLSIYVRSATQSHQSFAKRLLDLFPTNMDGGLKALSPAGLAEPLTSREVEVLRLICAGRSNQEIAGELVITLNTVKRHNNNLFGKLGVTNRAQAIIRAHQLSLI